MSLFVSANSFAARAVFVLFLELCVASSATCADQTSYTGFPSFESFVSSGTQVSYASDGGALFINPAAIQNMSPYILSHSFAGYDKITSFQKNGVDLDNSWSALGILWRPERYLGQLVVGAGYYNPVNMNMSQSMDLSEPEMTTWGSHVRFLASSRRGGIGVSYLVSPSWSVGLSCSGVWRNEESIFRMGQDWSSSYSGSIVKVASFAVTHQVTKETMLEAIAGFRLNLNSRFSVGAAWEAPVKVISSTNSSTTSGITESTITDPAGKVTTKTDRIRRHHNNASSSLEQTPQQLRVGMSWADSGTVLSFGLNRRSGFVDEYDDKYAAAVDWSIAARYPIFSDSALHVSVRATPSSVRGDEPSDGGGSLEFRGGGTYRVGSTEFAMGLSYVRGTDRHLLDPSVPETARLLQGLLGLNSYFM